MKSETVKITIRVAVHVDETIKFMMEKKEGKRILFIKGFVNEELVVKGNLQVTNLGGN